MTLYTLIRQAPEGEVNPERIPVSDPAAMARKIKEVARFFGADVVGITHLDQAYVYSHRAKGGLRMAKSPATPSTYPISMPSVWGLPATLTGT